MITKELFLKIIQLILEQDAIDEDFSGAIERMGDGRFLFNVDNKKYEALMLLLKENTNDKNDWISYWLYELEAGLRAEEGTVISKEGKNIPMNTAEDLYNLLRDNTV